MIIKTIEKSIEYIIHGQLVNAVRSLENHLRSLPESPFHRVLGRDLLKNIQQISGELEKFYLSRFQKFEIASIYAQINEFEINPDKWFCSFYSCAIFIDPNCTEDPYEDYLAKLEGKSHSEHFILLGMEDLQEAFRQFIGSPKNSMKRMIDPHQESFEIAYALVIARFFELMRDSHLRACERNRDLQKVPLISGSYSGEYFYISKMGHSQT